MEAVAAFGLASNILQVVDFASTIVSRGRKLYNSADGRIEEHAVLDAGLENLTELYNTLRGSPSHKDRKATPTDRQLIKLQNESEEIVKELRTSLENVRITGQHRKWQSIYQALRSVSTDKEISRLAGRLQSIRNEVNTVILVSLRHRIDELAIHSGDGADAQDRDGNNVTEQLGDILVAIRENNWQGSNGEDVHAFSKVTEAETTQSTKTRFCRFILARLYYRQMPDRVEAIPPAFNETFEWIFSCDRSSSTQTSPQSFAEWLQRDNDSIYWITGKPGSGKSTLMKYISNDPRLPSLLAKWANGQNLTQVSFYFWNSESLMQMSRLGLFQALVYTCLKGNDDLIIDALAERWDQFNTFGGGREPMEWPELRRVFNHIIADQSRKFFFAIDGLDEFDGEPKEIIELILETARSNVKLCLSSRPWLSFEDAFQGRPSLLMENLTESDISTFVHGRFDQDSGFLRLQGSEPTAAAALIDNIVEKASGVFLWVHLVVQSLLEGLSNSDHMSDLQYRLDALPGDLEALFNKILDRLQPEYFKQACETFRLLRAHREILGDGSPTLLSMYFADDPDTKSSRDTKYMTDDDLRHRAETMRRKLSARCKGFIEIDQGIVGYLEHRNRHINYLHRTARDFIESDTYWPTVLQNTGHNLFKPEEYWANAYLWMHEIMPLYSSSLSSASSYGNDLVNNCVQIAFTLQEDKNLVQKSYLDQVFKISDRSGGQRKGLNFACEFLNKALPQLSAYLALAIHSAAPEDIKHIFRYPNIYLCNWDINGRIVKYYRTPPCLRWLRRKPTLAPYE